jgi:hypothetical protein
MGVSNTTHLNFFGYLSPTNCTFPYFSFETITYPLGGVCFSDPEVTGEGVSVTSTISGSVDFSAPIDLSTDQPAFVTSQYLAGSGGCSQPGELYEVLVEAASCVPVMLFFYFSSILFIYAVLGAWKH